MPADVSARNARELSASAIFGLGGDIGVVLFFAVGLSGACTLAGEDPLSSGYKSASVSATENSGVADGHTPIAITVTGSPDVELIVEVIGQGARFQVGDSVSPQEKTVYLRDQGDGTGAATAGVIATEPGLVTVALKADRARTAYELDFQPVVLAVGPGTPVRFEPGQVVHQVCVAVNSTQGVLQVDSLERPGSEEQVGTFTPASLPVRTQMPTGVTCPSEPLDSVGWLGYAVFTWGTSIDFAQVSLSYLGSDDAPLTTERLALSGEPFVGYSVDTMAPVANESWTSIELSLSYQATGPLPSAPAAGVRLQNIRFIPDNGPMFLGSSSGSAEEAPVTDLDGGATLFFDTAVELGTYALFVTPENGATEYLTDIVIQ